tara:strand:+ start:17456 stop:18427 length:972 start_codon:yes stop_codon:yes gene_type:complete
MITFLSGCMTKEERVFQEYARHVDSAIQKIEINKKSIERRVESEKYGQYQNLVRINLMKLESELSGNDIFQEMKDQFLRDMSKNGSIYKNMMKEYEDISSLKEYQAILNTTNLRQLNYREYSKSDLERIYDFSNRFTYEQFDNRFIDYNNTLAALSNEINPVVVDSVSKELPASAFVGNPQYGQWKSNNNGEVFWEFAQTYLFLSMMGDMFETSRYGYSSRYRYDSWHNKRNWSYYNDNYVKNYASKNEKRSYNAINRAASKKYTSNLKPNRSPASKQNRVLATKKSKYSSSVVSNRSKNNNLRSRTASVRSSSYGRSSSRGK